jgi:phage/plasmid-associated DNA primase
MNVKDTETTFYQQLVKEMLDVCAEKKYKREKNTGIVYQQVKPYAYERYKIPTDFLNEIFYDDRDFKSHVANMDNLVKFMKQYDDSSFPFLEYNKEYIGFKNGVLNIETCEFNEFPEGITARKYIDQDFTYSMDTPLMDNVLDYQFEPEVRDFIYACLGRMFGIRDNFGFMLYLLGEAGCGKSLVIDVLCECFNNVGAISDSYETKYGLSYLYDKDIVVCDDVPKDIHKVFPQQAFQTIITGGKISTACKNADAITVEWKTPLLFAGNWHVSYLDKGQISRRVLVANFERNVYQPDITLKNRIIESELPAFIYKCVTYYNDLLEKSNGKGIWQLCPEYFLEQQEEVRIERNPLYKFLKDNTTYKEGNMVFMEDIKNSFVQWLGKKVHKLDNGTFGQVNQDYIVEIVKVCKHCKKEGRKGCCDKYNNKDRTTKHIVKNIELTYE